MRAMALQVSVLPKDLFVSLRPSAHYFSTLCATARSLPPDTAACCCLFVRSHYPSDTCIRLLVCAALSGDWLVLSRPFPIIRPRCALLHVVHRWTQLHVAISSDLFNTFPALSGARRPAQRFQKIGWFFLVFPSTISPRCAPLRVVQLLTLLHVGISSILFIVIPTLSQACQDVERL